MTLSDWYILIEANPADWDQRLVFSDWLLAQRLAELGIVATGVRV